MLATRMRAFPRYIFADLGEAIRRVEASGKTVINLGISDPDQPPAPDVVARLQATANGPLAHRYPPYNGTAALRRTVALWYRNRFGVHLDPDRQIAITLGSKEALVHLGLVVADPGSVILVPDPGYPAYQMPAVLFGAAAHPVPLTADRQFLPDLEAVPQDVVRRTRLLYLNYPNNPTGALASLSFWRRTMEWAQAHGIVVASDLAYADIVYEGAATSVLQATSRGAVESLTFSKSFSMQGWRLAAMVGDPEIMEGFMAVESQINAGVFLPIQEAGVIAMEEGMSPGVLETYRQRRDLAVAGLNRLGFSVEPPKAAVYCWVPTPHQVDADIFAGQLLDRAGVAVTPGSAFGPGSRHYFRLSLTVPERDLQVAFDRWASLPELLP